eukprot:9498798-Pyramimonas_sp.AAC.1
MLGTSHARAAPKRCGPEPAEGNPTGPQATAQGWRGGGPFAGREAVRSVWPPPVLERQRLEVV